MAALRLALRMVLVLAVTASAHAREPASAAGSLGPPGPARRPAELATPAAGARCEPLSADLAASVAVASGAGPTVLLAVADANVFAAFGRTWLHHLAAAGVTYHLLVALDASTAAALEAGGQSRHCAAEFNATAGPLAGSGGGYKYGSSHYTAVTWRKVEAVRRLVEAGFNVLHSDLDVLWFQDPLHVLGSRMVTLYNAPDIAISSDRAWTANPPAAALGFEVGGDQFTDVNTGIYLVRSTQGALRQQRARRTPPAARNARSDHAPTLLQPPLRRPTGGRELMRAWADMRLGKASGNDQVALYAHIRRPPVVRREGAHFSGVFRLPNSSATMGVATVGALMNGYSFFIARLHAAPGAPPPLALHMTWAGRTVESKRHRFREMGALVEAPGYFAPPAAAVGGRPPARAAGGLQRLGRDGGHGRLPPGRDGRAAAAGLRRLWPRAGAEPHARAAPPALLLLQELVLRGAGAGAAAPAAASGG